MENDQYIVVVDLEATCWDANVPGLPRRQTVDDMEVIELGCAVATNDGHVIDTQSFFVRPIMHPKLSLFCSELTGIHQKWIQNAPDFTEAVQLVNHWLKNFSISKWGSWGGYDKHQLEVEQQRHGCAPAFLKLPHLNLKKLWRKGKASSRRSGLLNALSFHGLKFEGQHHRGIDDARNICRLLSYIDVT